MKKNTIEILKNQKLLFQEIHNIPTLSPVKPTKNSIWTNHEDEILARAVQKHQAKDWDLVSEYLLNKDPKQCLHRWKKVLNPDLKKGPWSKEEDELLKNSVAICGDLNWKIISSHIPKRTPKQCRERWKNKLDPSINHSGWTKEEDRILIEKQTIYGNSWSKIKTYLPGRPDNMIKNRWNSTLKKQIELKKYEQILKKKREPKVKTKKNRKKNTKSMTKKKTKTKTKTKMKMKSKSKPNRKRIRAHEKMKKKKMNEKQKYKKIQMKNRGEIKGINNTETASFGKFGIGSDDQYVNKKIKTKRKRRKNKRRRKLSFISSSSESNSELNQKESFSKDVSSFKIQISKKNKPKTKKLKIKKKQKGREQTRKKKKIKTKNLSKLKLTKKIQVDNNNKEIRKPKFTTNQKEGKKDQEYPISLITNNLQKNLNKKKISKKKQFKVVKVKKNTKKPKKFQNHNNNMNMNMDMNNIKNNNHGNINNNNNQKNNNRIKDTNALLDYVDFFQFSDFQQMDEMKYHSIKYEPCQNSNQTNMNKPDFETQIDPTMIYYKQNDNMSLNKEEELNPFTFEELLSESEFQNQPFVFEGLEYDLSSDAHDFPLENDSIYSTKKDIYPFETLLSIENNNLNHYKSDFNRKFNLN
ncbi:homeodomain-like protein-related [Anaeramoeba flamelloides]|uniref:Homeodomain-like protein-related n=1 Tax=Anaeramoeba flamelloides TaxID=1746091 RepID=A0ABQ8YNX3_9EUKA|nr:homeodomain-like protein-related [Anaeramoeba flamelloides]